MIILNTEVIIMASKLLLHCPACNGDLKITSLTCRNCGMELRGEFEPELGLFSQLSPEQREFLMTFLKCRGNMSQVQDEVQISYPTAKKRLDDVLSTLGLLEKETIISREVIDVELWQVNASGVRASEIVKQKLKESSGRATITSYSGNRYEIWAEPDGKSFGCDVLPPTHTYDIFDVVADFLEQNGGRAQKGTGRAPLGSEKCGLDTIAGVILKDYSGVPVGGNGFDPSFVIVAIMDWAGILHNRRGYVELTAQYRAMRDTAK